MKTRKYAYVDFRFAIPSKGKTDEELLEYAREQLYTDSHDIFKDLVRHGGEVAESFDRDMAVDYGMEEEWQTYNITKDYTT